MVQAGFATREAENVASSLSNLFDTEDIQPLAFISLSMAGGVIIAQEIADRVLPMLGFPVEPTSSTGFAASGAVKLALALAVGALAPGLSGAGLIAAAFIGVGHLASAGADFFNAIQRTGFLAESPIDVDIPEQAGGSGNVKRPSPNGTGGGQSRSVSMNGVYG